MKINNFIYQIIYCSMSWKDPNDIHTYLLIIVMAWGIKVYQMSIINDIEIYRAFCLAFIEIANRKSED